MQITVVPAMMALNPIINKKDFFLGEVSVELVDISAMKDKRRELRGEAVLQSQQDDVLTQTFESSASVWLIMKSQQLIMVITKTGNNEMAGVSPMSQI